MGKAASPGSQRKWEITGIRALDGTQPPLALLACGMPSDEALALPVKGLPLPFCCQLKEIPWKCGALLCEELGVHSALLPYLL